MNRRSSLQHSAKRAKTAWRIRILFQLYWLRWLWDGVVWDPSVRRKEYVDRVDQILKQKGRKV